MTSLRSPGSGAITVLEFSPDDRELSVGHRDGALNTFVIADPTESSCIARECDGGVNDLAYSPDGRFMVVASSNNVVQQFSSRPDNGTPWKIPLNVEPLAVTYCENGNTIAIETSTGELQLWDVATRTLRTTVKAHTSRINVLSVFPDGTTLASGGRDRRLQLWDTTSGERLTTLRGHSRQFFSIAVSLDGKTMASGGLAGDVRVWRSQP